MSYPIDAAGAQKKGRWVGAQGEMEGSRKTVPRARIGGGLGVVWRGEVTLLEQTSDPTAWRRVSQKTVF